MGNRKYLLSFHSPAVLLPLLSCVKKILENAIGVIMVLRLLNSVTRSLLASYSVALISISCPFSGFK